VSNCVVFLVGHLGKGLFASLAIAVGVDSLVGVLVDDVVADSSHDFYFLSFRSLCLSLSDNNISYSSGSVNSFFEKNKKYFSS